MTYSKAGDVDKALVELTKTIRLDPRTYMHRADMYMGVDDYENAAADYSEMIKLDSQGPEAALAYRRRGLAYLKLLRFDRAIHAFRHALQLKPDDEESRRGAKVALLRRREALEAEPQQQPAATPSGGGRAEWLVKTADGEEYGPVTKAELDNWVRDGRLNDKCQLLRDNWGALRWAQDVYPELTIASHRAAHRPIPVDVGLPEDKHPDAADAPIEETTEAPDVSGPQGETTDGMPDIRSRRRRRQ